MKRFTLILMLSVLTLLSLNGCSAIEQTSIRQQISVNPKLEANVSNDVRVELTDLKQGQLGKQDELKLFLDFITIFKYEDVETIIANAYPTMLTENKELPPEESLELLTMVKNITPTVIAKMDSLNLKGGWSIYIKTREYGVQIGHTGSLITCAFDGKQGWYIFGDHNGQFYNQIYDFIHDKQTK